MLQRVLMVAGEASGDVHGAGVVRELKKRVPSLDVYGMGGDAMRREGMDVIYHISSMSFMGFVEVARKIPFVRKVGSHLAGLLQQRRPDVVVLIDYPGFNLRFARKAKQHGIKVLYYISPQVWAWNKGRVKKMKHLVDRMMAVFPFEVDMYRDEGINVEFVGHPLLESVYSGATKEDFCKRHGLDLHRPLLGVFPGSRLQEVERILPVVEKAVHLLQSTTDVQVAVGVASNLGAQVIRDHLTQGSTWVLVENATHDLMKLSDAAIVTSGTATLETGMFATPMVVVYKTSPLTYLIGRLLVDVANIGLVNIVAGKTVVPELVQHHLTVRRLRETVRRLLEDEGYRATMRVELSTIRSKLGSPGASARVAEGIIGLAGAA
jgi:lipid-A-disaccharide synthase